MGAPRRSSARLRRLLMRRQLLAHPDDPAKSSQRNENDLGSGDDRGAADRVRDGLATAGEPRRLGRDVLHHRRSAGRTARVAGPVGARRAGEAAGRDHADAGAVRRCVADLSAGAAPRVRGAVRLLGIGLPLTIVAGA